MSGKQARNDRRHLANLVDQAAVNGITDSALIELIRYAMRHREILAPKEFEIVIRQKAWSDYSQKHNWKIDNIERTYEALASIELIIQAVDLHALLAEKHEVLKAGLESDKGKLATAFSDLETCAIQLGQKAAVDELIPDVSERIECCNFIVAILNQDDLQGEEKAPQRSKAIKPYVDRLQELAGNSTEYRKKLLISSNTIKRGGNTEGMQRWRIWLAKTWETRREIITVHEHQKRKSHKGLEPIKVKRAQELQRGIIKAIETHTYPEGLNLEDCQKIAMVLEKMSSDPREVIRALDKALSDYHSEMS